MKVIFSHGKESGPWGSKIQALAAIAKEQGCAVESIDYQGMTDPDERVTRLAAHLTEEQDEFVLVGSSMGGYVSLVTAMDHPSKSVFLLAPALYIPRYKHQAYRVSSPVEIVHGWSDDIIPVENSITFAKEHESTLHLIKGDHRLNRSLEEVARIFSSFLRATLSEKPG